MISTNTNLTHRAGHYPAFQDETSGIRNLEAHCRRQRNRLGWANGFDAGLFWGMIAGALIVTGLFLISNR